MPRERVNGIDINYEDLGRGRPLLMLHGFTGSAAAWQGIPEALAKQFRVIAIDIVGHGYTSSPEDPDRYSIPNAVHDLLELLDRLEVDQTAVLGYSMGGRVALHLALESLDRVSAMILESAGVGISDPAERAKREESDERQARMIEEQRLEAFINHWESVPLFASQRNLSDCVRQRQRELRLSQNPRGIAHSLRGMGAGVMQPVGHRLQEFTMPVLYLAGEYDEKYREIGELVCGRMPNARCVVVPGAGHTIHLEQPEKYVNRVREFLNSPASES